MLLLGLLLGGASAFVPGSTPVIAPAGRRAAASVRLSLEIERSESWKCAFISAFSGSLASAPIKASSLIASVASSPGEAPKWSLLASSNAASHYQFGLMSMFVELALFGVIYRCVVRYDDNDALKQGCVGGFALFHAMSATQVTKMWSPEMFLQIGANVGVSALAFGVAASTLEFCFDRGVAFRLPGALPFDDYDRWRSGGRASGYMGGGPDDFRGVVEPTYRDQRAPYYRREDRF